MNLPFPAAEDDSVEINLALMLDIVFIMLIFFVVTVTFIKESGVDVELPPGISKVPDDVESINVTVESRGVFIVNGRLIGWDVVPISPEPWRPPLADDPPGAVQAQAEYEMHGQVDGPHDLDANTPAPMAGCITSQGAARVASAKISADGSVARPSANAWIISPYASPYTTPTV
jgi:hypothetical protein